MRKYAKTFFLMVGSILTRVMIIIMAAQMVYSPIVTTAYAENACNCQYEQGSIMAGQASDCAGKPGRNWNCCTNHCDYEAEVLETNQTLFACKKQPDAQKQQSCVESTVAKVHCEQEFAGNQDKIKLCITNHGENPESFLGPADDFFRGNSDEKVFKSFSVFYVYVIFFGLSLIVFAMKKAGWTCPDYSAIIIMIATLLAIASELGTVLSLKNSLDKLPTKYKATEDKASQFMDIQKNAFAMLAEEQGIRSKVELGRAVAYGITMGLYMISVVVAGVEIYLMHFTSTACAAKPKVQPDAGKDLGFLDKIGNAFRSAPAGPAGAIGNVLNGSNVAYFLGYPAWRMVFGAIMAALSGILMGASAQSSKLAKDRQAKLEELKKRYLESQYGFFCRTRNDPNVPECYCYDEMGKKDPDKSGSESCNRYWDSLASEKALDDKADYTGGGVGDQPVGCLTEKGVFDPTCKCRKSKHVTGENACYKSLMPRGSFDIGNAQVIAGLDQASSSLLNGNSSINRANASNLVRMAAKLYHKAKGQLPEINKKLAEQGMEPVILDGNTFLKAYNGLKGLVTPELKAQLSQSGMVPTSGGTSGLDSTNLSALGQKAANEIKKKIGADDSLFYSGGGGKAAGDKTKGTDPMAGLFGNDGDGGPKGKVEDLLGTEKNYKYGDHDIHKNDSVPIWQIITNRYQKSGFARLFPDEK